MADNDPEEHTTVTAAEFDRDPAKVYRQATSTGPVTVLDSKGQPSMTVVVPRNVGSDDVVK